MAEIESVNWTPSMMLEIKLPDPDAFLKIKETLTRIGIASKKENTLYPSCHILHKKGRYYITHFLEMFLVEGRESTLSKSDLDRRTAIALLLEQWGLCTIVTEVDKEALKRNLPGIKILSYKEKSSGKWNIVHKFLMMSDRT